MKKKTLIFLLSTCLLTQSAGFVSAADFSAIPAENVNAEENFSPEDTSISSDYLPVTDDVSDESSDDTASETDSETSDVLPDTDTVTDSDSETLSEETVPENIEIEPEASPAEDDSDDLLFSDGESEDFNDGSDFSTIVSAASEIPDHDMWIADTVKSGLVVDGKNIQTKSLYNLITQASVKPVYQELGERILSNKPMLVLSSIWKGVIKQEFYDNQKLIYEALLTDYLRYVDSTDSKGFDMSQFERANSYLIKIFNDLSNYYLQKGIYDWKPEDFMKLDAKEANKLFHSVDSMKTAISLVGDTCSTTKELIELCSKVNAFKNAADERILLIQKARDAGSSNTAFAEACDVILAQLNSQSIDVSYLRSQSASAAMKKCTETMISELSKQNPALKALSYGSSAMDILFNTSNINSDNLKLSLLYTMDCYFNTAMTSSSFTYARYENAENATTFTKCFQGYTMFQLYGNSVAKSYISGVTSGGTLNRTFADIFYREGVQSANEWQSLCDTQNNIRRNILSILANFYQIYNRFYLKDEYTNALKDQTTATPTPTPKPLVPVDYNVTLPESKNPVKDSSFYNSNGWSYFDDGTLVFSGTEFLPTECPYKNIAKKVIVSEGFVHMKDSCFSNWTNLKSIWLPDSLTKLNYCAFKNCQNLEEIRFPSKYIEIDSCAFENCISLKTVNISAEYILRHFDNETFTFMGDSIFEGCTSLETVTLPYNLTGIYSGCFKGCTNLQNIVLPDTIRHIAANAFNGCTSLKQINIPDSVTDISYGAFQNCSSLESIILPGEISGGFSYCGSFFSDDTLKLYRGLDSYVFYNCANLKEVIFKKGNSTQLIGNHAFANCPKLEKVIISDNVKFIDHNAFENCTSLTQIDLQHIQGLCHDAFKNCTSLKNVNFPQTRILYATNAFQNCVSLDNIKICGCISDGTFSGCINLKKVVLSAAEYIGSNAFYGCKNLTEIVLPKNFTDSDDSDNTVIGDKAFYNCSNLKKITLPDNVTSIGAQCFYNCKSLQTIVFPKGIYYLIDEQLANCSSLKSVTFLWENNSVSDSQCNSSVFKGCSNLKSIYGHSGTAFETVSKQLGLTFISSDAPSVIPAKLTLTPGNRCFKASWKKVSSVNGYQIQYSKNKNFSQSTSKFAEDYNTSSLTVKNLIANQTYYVRIRAYRKVNHKNFYGKWSATKNITVLPVKVPAVFTPVLKSGKQYFRASWKKTSVTSGYQLQYSVYKNFQKTITKTLVSSSKNNITISKLKRNKRYYVRIRAYRNANSKKYYGKWSKTRSIVVK